MEKEDVLAKARAEQSDEREMFVRDRSAMWLAAAMVTAAAFFTVVRMEQNLPIMDLAATVSFSAAVCMIYRFVKLRQINYLISGIMLAAVAVFSSVRFFTGH